MTENKINRIVEEVMKRLAVLSQEKKYLTIVFSCEENVLTCDFLKNGETREEPSVIYYNTLKENFDAEVKSFPMLMEKYEGLLIKDVTLKYLCRIASMRLDDPMVELVTEALRQGKPVNVESKWIDVTKLQPALQKKINNTKKILIEYGLTFNKKQEAPTVEKTGTTSLADSKITIDKKVIAKQDLKNVLRGEIVVRRDAVFTTTAKDLIEKRNIRINRCENL